MTNRRYHKTRKGWGKSVSAPIVDSGVSEDPDERENDRRASRKRAAFCALFTKVNSIVAGKAVPVRLASNNWTFSTGGHSRPVAWTDGEVVWIARDRFDRLMLTGPSLFGKSALLTKDALTTLKGLNYHELAHVLFTPRNTHKPIPQIRKLMSKFDSGEILAVGSDGSPAQIRGSNVWHCFNILEDQRIETLFAGKWSIAGRYFTLAVTEFVIGEMKKNQQIVDEYSSASSSGHAEQLVALTHCLTHGRLYLPDSLRASVRTLFVDEFGDADATKVENWIDEFRFLVFPTDGNRAVEIIKEFTLWLASKTLLHNGEPERFGNSTGGHEHLREGQAEKAADQRKPRDRMKEQWENRPAPAGDDEDTVDDDVDSDSESDDGSGTSDGEGTRDSDGDSAEAGSEDGTPTTPDVDEVIRQLQDTADDSRAELQSDVIDTLKVMKNYEDKLHQEAEKGKFSARFFSVPTAAESTNRLRISTALQQLRHDAEPQWAKRRDIGRINIPALMAGRGVDLDIFDEWTDTGEDATSIEVVILLDQSTSMSSQIAAASGAMWVLKGACDDLEIPCTVIGYSNDHAVLLSRDEVVGSRVGRYPVVGGTQATGALEEAHRIFRGSDRRFKLLFSVTDGQWYCPEVSTKLVKEIRALGVWTDLIYLTANYQGEGAAQWVADLKKELDAQKWNGHETGVVCSTMNAMVAHIMTNLSRVVTDAMADAL